MDHINSLLLKPDSVHAWAQFSPEPSKSQKYKQVQFKHFKTVIVTQQQQTVQNFILKGIVSVISSDPL